MHILKQAACDVQVMPKQLTIPVLSLYYDCFFIYICFQEELEEIWSELLQGSFQTVLMSKTSAL